MRSTPHVRQSNLKGVSRFWRASLQTKGLYFGILPWWRTGRSIVTGMTLAKIQWGTLSLDHLCPENLISLNGKWHGQPDLQSPPWMSKAQVLPKLHRTERKHFIEAIQHWRKHFTTAIQYLIKYFTETMQQWEKHAKKPTQYWNKHEGVAGSRGLLRCLSKHLQWQALLSMRCSRRQGCNIRSWHGKCSVSPSMLLLSLPAQILSFLLNKCKELQAVLQSNLRARIKLESWGTGNEVCHRAKEKDLRDTDYLM